MAGLLATNSQQKDKATTIHPKPYYTTHRLDQLQLTVPDRNAAVRLHFTLRPCSPLLVVFARRLPSVDLSSPARMLASAWAAAAQGTPPDLQGPSPDHVVHKRRSEAKGWARTTYTYIPKQEAPSCCLRLCEYCPCLAQTEETDSSIKRRDIDM